MHLDQMIFELRIYREILIAVLTYEFTFLAVHLTHVNAQVVVVPESLSTQLTTFIFCVNGAIVHAKPKRIPKFTAARDVGGHMFGFHVIRHVAYVETRISAQVART